MEDTRTDPDRIDVVLRFGVAVLTFITAAIHLSLGGLLFTTNAVAYAVLGRRTRGPDPDRGNLRFLTRLALLGFTIATIVGWALVGARYPLAYIDKGIELVLIGVLLTDIRRADGGLLVAIRRTIRVTFEVFGRRAAADRTSTVSK